MILRAAAGILAGVLVLAVPQAVSAQGLFESFFGGLSRALHAVRTAPPPAEPVRAFAEPYHTERTINPPSVHIDTGPATAFCVRTCDGHFFPVRAHAGMSAADACHAFCPGSPAKIYSGSTIDYAVARDGSRYGDLANAYAYRKHIVAGCTCNGHDQFGLAPVDVASDPTLRPGDVVATKGGMVAFTGRINNTANFTPAESYSHFSRSYRDRLADMEIRSVRRY